MDDFPTYLGQLTSKMPVRPSPKVRLRQWLDQIGGRIGDQIAQSIEAGWIGLEQLMAAWQTQNPAFNFRTALAQAELTPPAAAGAKQGKYLALGDLPEEQILLIVGIAPVQGEAAFDITVEVYPTGAQAFLPPSLQLTVMDEAQTPVLQAEGRQSEGLEFQFSGEPGESFSVQISLHQHTLTEEFEI
jgi:hypothetical protein